MPVTDFEQRRNKILEVVVEAYVDTASPVGSALISRKIRPSLSPATIRNMMAELERDGLLEQPHTSAGRVPTDRGYRVYVDSVMDVRRLPPEEVQELELAIEPEELDVAQLLERASEALAQLAQQAAFVVVPTVKQSTVKQIELVPLSVRKMLCVLIAHEEMIASHVVEVEEPMSRDEATALARFLNTELIGLPFNALIESLERRLLAEGDSFYHLVKRSLSILQHALSTEPAERLLLEGTSYLVAQPEFSRHPRRTNEMLKQLESQHDLLQCLRQGLAAEGVRVRIGSEVQVPAFERCSVVTAPFAIADEVAGGVGVLGPTRMDYRGIRALVEGMARAVTELLTRWAAS